MDACIKNVDEESWKKLRIEAIKRGTTMGRVFDEIVGNAIGNEDKKSNWDDILYGRKRLKKIVEKVDWERVREELRKDFEIR